MVMVSLLLSGCNLNTASNQPAETNTDEPIAVTETSEPMSQLQSGEKISETTSETTETSEDTEQEASIDFSNLKKGDIVTIGTFEQDGDSSNGKEPVEWEVLFADDEKALVISKYILTCGEFGQNWSFDRCKIRDFFDNDFYNQTFSEEEKAKIQTVSVPALDEDDTQGKIFALSLEEVKKYYSFNAWVDEVGYSDALITSPTQYAINCGVRCKTITEETYKSELQSYGVPNTVIDRQGAAWWLRDSNEGHGTAYYVTYFGEVGMREGHSYDDIGFRPAMYIKK